MTSLLPVIAVLALLLVVLLALRFGRTRMGRWRRGGLALIGAGLGAVLLVRWPLFGLAVLTGAAWLYFTEAPPSAPTQTPDAVARARALLGVPPGADEEQIRAAFRRAMTKAHPDAGGNANDAAALSAARDLLLKSLK